MKSKISLKKMFLKSFEALRETTRKTGSAGKARRRGRRGGGGSILPNGKQASIWCPDFQDSKSIVTPQTFMIFHIHGTEESKTKMNHSHHGVTVGQLKDRMAGLATVGMTSVQFCDGWKHKWLSLIHQCKLKGLRLIHMWHSG